MNAIEIKGLKKSFRGMYALNGLNMTVPVGSIYGFIGENGSGKSRRSSRSGKIPSSCKMETACWQKPPRITPPFPIT